MISSYFESIAGVESPTVDCDIRDFETDLKIAKTAYENGYRNYRIIYYKILDYTVPIAAQTSIPISHNIDYSKLQEVAQIGHKRMTKMGRPKSENTKKKVLSIRVSDQLYSQLLAYAEKHNMTTTDVVLRGVETFISKQE